MADKCCKLLYIALLLIGLFALFKAMTVNFKGNVLFPSSVPVSTFSSSAGG